MTNDKVSSPYSKIIGVVILALAVGIVAYVLNNAGEPSGVIVLGEDFSNLHALKSMKDDYKAKYGVDIEFVGLSFDAFDQKANQDLASGTGLYDVFLHYSSVLHNYAGRNWVLTVNELKEFAPDVDYAFESDLFPEVWKDSSFYQLESDSEPTAIGYPFAANTMVLVYNRALFEDVVSREEYKVQFGKELEAPKDWHTFYQLAEFFTNPDKSTFGVVLQGASGSPLYWEWCNFAFGMGGGVMQKEYGWQSFPDTPLIIDSTETIEATRFYASLKPFNYGDFFSTGQAEQQEHMRTKKIAMAIMWSDSLFAVINGPNGDNLGFAPIPGDRSMIGGGTFYINKKTKNAKETCRYVARMMQKDTQVRLMKQGLCSGLRSAYEDPEVRKLPYIDAVKESLDRGVYMLESGPDSGLIVETLEATIQQIWRGEISPKEGLVAAQEKISEERISFIK